VTHADVERLFTYHPPTESQQERYKKLREGFRGLADLVLDLTPESPEQTLALRDIHRASMQANAAIAVNEC
jgi:hypothetical protein